MMEFSSIRDMTAAVKQQLDPPGNPAGGCPTIRVKRLFRNLFERSPGPTIRLIPYYSQGGPLQGPTIFCSAGWAPACINGISSAPEE